ALDLGHQQRMPAGLPEQRAGLVDVLAVAGEGDGEVVDLERRRRANVLPVLVGEGAGGQSAALAVDALVVAELAADQHPGLDARAVDPGDLQADLAVVEQQYVARGN